MGRSLKGETNNSLYGERVGREILIGLVKNKKGFNEIYLNPLFTGARGRN
jgi:hypothetical protein